MVGLKIYVTIQFVFTFFVFGVSPALAEGATSTSQPMRVIASASELDYPPFSIIRNDGTADGFSVELLQAVAQAVGMNVTFRVGPWDEIKNDLITGRLDALPLVSYSAEREEQLDFTTPYLRLHGTIFVRKGDTSIRGEADLKDKAVIVMRGDTAHEYLIQNALCDNLILTDTFDEALRLLSTGNHDAVVIQHLVGLQLIKKLDISNLVSVDTFSESSIKPKARPLSGFEQKFCIAVKEGDKELQALLNEGLSLVIAGGQYDQLYDKWFGPILADRAIEWTTLTRLVLYILVPILLLFGGVGILYLKKEVARKTLKLKDSEARLRTLIDTLPDLVWLKDPSGKYLACNRQFERFFGAREEDIIGKTDYAFVDRELADFFRMKDQSAIDAGRSVKFEEKITFADDGHREILETIKTPVYKSDGTLAGVLGIGRDITERKQADLALRQSDHRLKLALTSAKAGIWEWDLRTNKNIWSEELYRLYDLNPGYIPACYQSWLHSILPEDRDAAAAAVATAVDQGGEISIEYRINTKDNSTRWVMSKGQPQFDALGKTIKYLGIVIDITDRKQISQAIAERERYLKTILQTTADGFWVIDSKGKILEVNEATCHMTGYSRDEVLQLHIGDIDTVLSTPEGTQRIERIIKRGTALFESRHRKKDGTVFDAEVSVTYLDEDGGKFFCFSRAIDERKRVEDEREKLRAQLSQAQKMESIGRLAGGVAHDFNNKLGVILGNVEMAMEDVNGSCLSLHDYLAEIQDAARHSAELTRQLLAFARKQAITPKVINLNEVIEGMLKMLRRLIGEDINLVWSPGSGLHPVHMDPAQVDQILANLCVNARDAISGVGKITIETRNVSIDDASSAMIKGILPGHYVNVAVFDDGIGMSREIKEHLFEPFFTTKPLGKGTGLGLATVFGIVKQNKGFIDVFSEPGEGSIFKIYIPRHEGRDTEAQSKAQLEIRSGRNETILLVEDEPAILKVTQTMLKRLGYQVLSAGTVTQAVGLATEHSDRIQLLITDVIMPEMNGQELANQLQKLNPRIKVLFMSGYTADVIARHGVVEAGVDYIQKPFSTKAISVKIREILERGAQSR